MFCKNCGNEIIDGQLNCAACGAPAPQLQTPVESEQPQAPVHPQYQYQVPQQPQYQAPVQPQYQAPLYQVPQRVRNPMDGLGYSIAALVLGCCGVVFGFFFVVNILFLICSILGIVFGYMGRKRSIACYGKASGMATAGFVLGIIGTAICGIGVATCTVCLPIMSGCASTLY